MQRAWHLDVHRGPVPRLLEPDELVAAAFDLEPQAVAPGQGVHTRFGIFYVDEIISRRSRTAVILHLQAPGSIYRFGVSTRLTRHGSPEGVLFNAVEPQAFWGRVYFRLIEVGHHVMIERALKRLVRAGLSPE